jgi:hypothetical protein
MASIISSLYVQLERINLQEYTANLITEGFDTWESVLDVTESDL